MKPIHVILYVLLTLTILGIISFLGLFLLVRGLSDTEPTVDANSTLVITLSGNIPEYIPPSDFPFDIKTGTSLKSILDNIEKAKADRRIKGILLKINANFMGWAKVDEIKQKLEDFKTSGKYVIAYLGSYVSEKDYYTALAADSIFAVPGGFLEMNGLVIQTVHLPGMLEKLGITLEYFSFGKYKSHSGETLGRKKHTAPVLEMLNDLLDQDYNTLVSAIAERWDISASEVKAIIDKGDIRAEKFKEIGWLTDILYEDQLFDRLKRLNHEGLNRKLNKISSETYAGITMESLGLNKGRNRIALIYSQGVVQEGEDSVSPLTLEETAGTTPIIRAIRRATKSKSTKAIIFRVDSPGGSGLGCDLVWREILEAKKSKPVIVSMSDYAASGGYWVSMGATAIVAQPTTLTGSIGIWGIFPNISGLYDKLGLIEENVKRGEHADMMLFSKKMSSYEKELYRDYIHNTYVEFVSKAAESRGKSYDELEKYAQGRAWTGAQAKEFGLIDELGGMDKAIEVAREKANIDSSASTKIVVYKTQKTFLEKLMSDPFSTVLRIFKQGNLKNTVQSVLNNQRPIIWPMMPYQFRVQ